MEVEFLVRVHIIRIMAYCGLGWDALFRGKGTAQGDCCKHAEDVPDQHVLTNRKRMVVEEEDMAWALSMGLTLILDADGASLIYSHVLLPATSSVGASRPDEGVDLITILWDVLFAIVFIALAATSNAEVWLVIIHIQSFREIVIALDISGRCQGCGYILATMPAQKP